MNQVVNQVVIYPTLAKGGEGGFKDWKRQGNVIMIVLLKPIKDPGRVQWHEVK
jgi:hypothetical protein